jgi:nitric oxide reductase NorE protein
VSSRAGVERDALRLPGETGVWVLVFGDLTVFALFFSAFLFHRGQELDLYQVSQLTLNRHFGALNTLLLLTSSWFVALALAAMRGAQAQRAVRLLAAAMGCGVAFAIVKYCEYGEKIRQGITPATNDFFMYYFVLTGIHFIHVLVGLGVLGWMYTRVRLRPAADIRPLECGGIYWHMVDLLWVVLFALFYLMH